MTEKRHSISKDLLRIAAPTVLAFGLIRGCDALNNDTNTQRFVDNKGEIVELTPLHEDGIRFSTIHFAEDFQIKQNWPRPNYDSHENGTAHVRFLQVIPHHFNNGDINGFILNSDSDLDLPRIKVVKKSGSDEYEVNLDASSYYSNSLNPQYHSSNYDFGDYEVSIDDETIRLIMATLEFTGRIDSIDKKDHYMLMRLGERYSDDSMKTRLRVEIQKGKNGRLLIKSSRIVPPFNKDAYQRYQKGGPGAVLSDYFDGTIASDRDLRNGIPLIRDLKPDWSLNYSVISSYSPLEY